MPTSKIADLRKDYSLNGFSEQDVLENPIDQFKRWFDEALNAQVIEPNAMHLSTVDSEGQPHGRIVLLKEVDNFSFVFYTNYNSNKSADLEKNPLASLTFWWAELERQVRILGKVEKVSDAESDAYFAIRPRGSQIGAWVSDQSKVIESRDVLNQKLAFYEAKFANTSIPRPPHWGGYRLIPSEIEFWQGRPSRLHDRIRYQFYEQNWQFERLSP